jgi:hypothetical protein
MDNRERNHSLLAGGIVLAVAACIFVNNNDVYGYVRGVLGRGIHSGRDSESIGDFRVTVESQPFGCNVCLKYVGSQELTDVDTVTRIRLGNGRYVDFRRHSAGWKAGEVKRIEMPVGSRAVAKEILTGTASVGSKRVKLYAAFNKKQT